MHKTYTLIHLDDQITCKESHNLIMPENDLAGVGEGSISLLLLSYSCMHAFEAISM